LIEQLFISLETQKYVIKIINNELKYSDQR